MVISEGKQSGAKGSNKGHDSGGAGQCAGVPDMAATRCHGLPTSCHDLSWSTCHACTPLDELDPRAPALQGTPRVEETAGRAEAREGRAANPQR